MFVIPSLLILSCFLSSHVLSSMRGGGGNDDPPKCPTCLNECCERIDVENKLSQQVSRDYESQHHELDDTNHDGSLFDMLSPDILLVKSLPGSVRMT